MKNTFTSLRSRGVALKAAILASSTFATAFSYADTAADIAAAKTEGLSNVTLAVGAVIAIAAVAFGISLIKGLLSR